MLLTKAAPPRSVFERHPRSTAIGLMALAVALVLPLGEAIVRIAMPSVNFLGVDRRLFAPAGEDGYGNAPGFSGRAFGVEVRIDREGFRAGGNQARQAARVGNTVIFIGDSVTFGVGVEEGRTFVERFAAAHPDVETINAAVIGYSLEDDVATVRRLLERPRSTTAPRLSGLLPERRFCFEQGRDPRVDRALPGIGPGGRRVSRDAQRIPPRAFQVLPGAQVLARRFEPRLLRRDASRDALTARRWNERSLPSRRSRGCSPPARWALPC